MGLPAQGNLQKHSETIKNGHVQNSQYCLSQQSPVLPSHQRQLARVTSWLSTRLWSFWKFHILCQQQCHREHIQFPSSFKYNDGRNNIPSEQQFSQLWICINLCISLWGHGSNGSTLLCKNWMRSTLLSFYLKVWNIILNPVRNNNSVYLAH